MASATLAGNIRNVVRYFKGSGALASNFHNIFIGQARNVVCVSRIAAPARVPRFGGLMARRLTLLAVRFAGKWKQQDASVSMAFAGRGIRFQNARDVRVNNSSAIVNMITKGKANRTCRLRQVENARMANIFCNCFLNGNMMPSIWERIRQFCAENP